MTINRERIYEALFAQIKTAGTAFKSYSRTWKSAWDDPNARIPDMPMLIQQEQMEIVTWPANRGIGSVYNLEIRMEIYAKIPEGLTMGVPDPETTPGSKVLNPLLDALTAALAPSGYDGVQTLGDLVLDCRIEGPIIKVLGDRDPSGLCGAIVPVNIQVIP